MDCKRCGIEFKTKKYLVQHLKRKTECMSIVSEISLLDQLEELQRRDGIKCDKCKCIYKNKESLRKHICKIDKYEYEISILKEELEKEKRKSKRTIKNINNGTINNDNSINITVNSFGKEDISYITDNVKKTLMQIINGREYGVIDFIKKIHINSKYPENQNIKIENMKKGIVRIYEGDKWHFYTFAAGLDRLYNKTEVKFIDMINEISEDEILECISDQKIKMFNNNVGIPLGWNRILEDDESNDIEDTRVILVRSKEDIEEEKIKRNGNKIRRKNIDNILLQEIKNVE